MKIIFLTALVLFSSCVYAQKDDFDKAVDFCNCKLTSVYLSKFIASNSATASDKKSYEKIKNHFSNCEIGSAIEYNDLSFHLDKNNFKYSNSHFSRLINEVKNSYTDDLDKGEATSRIIKGIFESKDLESAIKKYIDADEIKSELSKTVLKYFDGKFKAKEEGATAETGNGTIDKEEELSNIIKTEVANQIQSIKPNPWAFNYSSIIFVILGIVIAFIIIRIRESFVIDTLKELQQSRSDHRGELNSLKRTVDGLSGSGGTRAQSYLNDNWQSNMEEKISEANRAINKIDDALSMLRGEIEKGINSASNFSSQPIIEQLPKAEILYASIPSKDGFFNENAISQTINPTASFYKFTITDSYGQKAKFEFLGNDERAVKDATNAPERILRPACKINNALNQNAKRIKTVTPGIVIKQNGKWEIDTLAEIEYE